MWCGGPEGHMQCHAVAPTFHCTLSRTPMGAPAWQYTVHSASANLPAPITPSDPPQMKAAPLIRLVAIDTRDGGLQIQVESIIISIRGILLLARSIFSTNRAQNSALPHINKPTPHAGGLWLHSTPRQRAELFWEKKERQCPDTRGIYWESFSRIKAPRIDSVRPLWCPPLL